MSTTDWFDHVPPAELEIQCTGQTHRLIWANGRITAVDHPNLDADRALRALGGGEVVCLDHLELWDHAIADGGFIGEWFDSAFTDDRLSWLRAAMDRMRNEGYHDFLHHLPLARAKVMGEFLVRFPPQWLDIAGACTAERWTKRQHDNPGQLELSTYLERAVAVRVRVAFARGLANHMLMPLGSAALIPLDIKVSGTNTARVQGTVVGPSRAVSIDVSTRWLYRVWAPGAAIIDNHLVLDLDHAEATALVVIWPSYSKGVQDTEPSVVRVGVERIDGRWSITGGHAGLFHSLGR